MERDCEVEVAGEEGWEGAPKIQEGGQARGGVGPWSPESLAQTPASDFISCVTFSKTVKPLGSFPGLWNGQGALNEVMDVMAFYTALGRE